MCSGLRDSWNLAWKLDRVLSGKSSARLLDEYEKERAPHVDEFIRISMNMGKVVCVPDSESAKARDEAFFGGAYPPMPTFPGLSGGVIAMDGDGRPLGGAGQLLPHDDLEREERTQRLDDFTGRAFVLLGEAHTLNTLDRETRALAERLEVAVIPIGPGDYRDAHGRIGAWLSRNQVDAVLARPDFYAFGAAREAKGVAELLKDLSARLSL